MTIPQKRILPQSSRFANYSNKTSQVNKRLSDTHEKNYNLCTYNPFSIRKKAVKKIDNLCLFKNNLNKQHPRNIYTKLIMVRSVSELSL